MAIQTLPPGNAEPQLGSGADSAARAIEPTENQPLPAM